MGTDNAYMALTGPLESIIKPKMRREFYSDYGNWFPKPYCQEHKQLFTDTKIAQQQWYQKPCCAKIQAYDRRTPGLFKEEFMGDGMIALNSKTYICWNDSTDETKLSSKGLNKRNNNLQRKQYKDVLTTGKHFIGGNRGFILKQGQIHTYSQQKRGLSYFYGKRQVLSDGVSTIAPPL